MNTLKWLLHWEDAPSLRRLPIALLRAALSGLTLGTLIVLVLTWFNNPHPMDVFRVWKYWPIAAAVGVIFSLSFYITCALPQSYIKPEAMGFSLIQSRIIRAAIGAIGGMAGVALAMYSVQYVVGVHIDNMGQMKTILIVDAFVGAAIALVISVWIHNQMLTTRAQYKALQAQINPHFFFNTLNTVQWFIDSDPAQAKQILGKLANLFRYTMSCSEKQLVPMKDELGFVKDYLEIEKARFGDRLRYELPQADGAMDVPGLLLQPLVENAVRHGIQKLTDGGEIRITLGPRTISVWNPIGENADLRAENLYRNGHALSNIQQRLKLLYAGRASMKFTEENRGVKVLVELPQ